MKAKRGTIQVGSVTLPFWEHERGWRFAWKDNNGDWKYTTKRDKSEALALGRKKARELSNGAVDIGALDPDQASLVRRVLALGLTHAELDEWQAEQQRPIISTADAVTEFLNVKRANRGRSRRNVKGLSGDLGSLSEHLGTKLLRTVSATDLEGWLSTYNGISPRRRKNLRSHAVTLFRWARERGYLPEKKTAAQTLEKPIVSGKMPATWTPKEMRTLLSACPSNYLPWLVLAGFAHFRQEELIIDPGSDKSPLDWSDFQWHRNIIIVRPETAKARKNTSGKRIVPILPIVRAWLYPMRKDSGPVCPADPPYKARDAGRPSLTSTLGALVGGWRSNALRHSSISYRVAQIGVAQTALEAGNSEAEIKKDYLDAKGRDEADAWYALLPKKKVPNGTLRNRKR